MAASLLVITNLTLVPVISAEAGILRGVKRLVYKVVTAPLVVADETIRLGCVAYCYSRVHGPRDAWGTIGGLVAKEKILLDKTQVR